MSRLVPNSTPGFPTSRPQLTWSPPGMPPPQRPAALHLQAAPPPRPWGPSLDWVSDRWQESQPHRADQWHPAPHAQHQVLQPCLLSLLESRGTLLSWPRDPRPWPTRPPPCPPADMETPALWAPARQGEGASLPIYLTGPHSAGHAMDHGPGRLWGQKHHSLVAPSPHTGPQQPEGPGRRGGREEGLAPSWGRKPAHLHSLGGVQEVL